MQRWFGELFPIGRVETWALLLRLSNPCILTILVTCLKMKGGHSYSIFPLLLRLVMALDDLSEGISSRLKIQRERKKRPESYDGSSESDNEDSLSGDEGFDSDRGKPSRNSDDVRLKQYATLMLLLITKILSFYQIEMIDSERASFAQSLDFASMLKRPHTFAAEVFRRLSPLRVIGLK